MFTKAIGKFAVLVGLSLGAMGSANAIPAVWTDSEDGIAHIGAGDSYSYTHSILGDGFKPLVDTISSASLSIWLADDALFGDLWLIGDSEETAGFKLDGGKWIKETVDNDFLDWEQFDLVVSSALLSDGLLNVTVKAFGGDFLFGGSLLTVHGDSASVPEPGTLGLFGLSMLAMGVAARRRRVK